MSGSIRKGPRHTKPQIEIIRARYIRSFESLAAPHLEAVDRSKIGMAGPFLLKKNLSIGG